MSFKENILVIKLSALGDFIIALGAMKAIRKNHPDAHITLFTTKSFRSLAQQSGYFDDIWIDSKPKLHQISQWMTLRNKLNNADFTRVYDLQNNDRTAIYYGLLKNPKPEWVGAKKGASHHYDEQDRTAGLAFDGLALTLKAGGIENISVDKMEWLKGDISQYNLPPSYFVIVPGSAISRPEKRWDKKNYIELSKLYIEKGYIPVLIGTAEEQKILSDIKKECPTALNLAGNTSFAQIVALSRNAAFAIGNDTGPMHMIAPTGCKTLVIFSEHSNPARNAPTGDNLHIIQKPFADLCVKDVINKLEAIL